MKTLMKTLAPTAQSGWPALEGDRRKCAWFETTTKAWMVIS
jgi:hypothetical protein